MSLPLYIVDAFTSKPFGGNPAAVCLLDRERDDLWMQSVAAELNLSETAFVLPKENYFELRWFTPNTEVELCGHATLASAHALQRAGLLGGTSELCFRSRSFGDLQASFLDSGEIELKFPALDFEEVSLSDSLAGALGVEVQNCVKNRFDYIVEVATEAVVRSAAPDFSALAQAEVEGFVLTARADANSEFDIVSRYFAPSVGIDEDPVTGAAHCGLAPYWQARAGLTQMRAYQASARGGELGVELIESSVFLRGRARSFVEGRLEA